ncbi:putative arylsulfatase [Sphingobium sp. SYK-6]|uniref:sulfatase family protein n=1 Tax=Sphingobium sp. (strain NBRC 103272 / SYK-6) TaxID=627192 RepID=UPI0002277589|nr:sulfatase-like hydrolase/transferase [Sphingobium sp. SYK-6]BAK67182.1 putative arylsulfatase [Sphingobium sp. SYK-6]
MFSRRAFLGTAAALPLAARVEAAPARPPHIVFIMADDLGYADLSFTGRTEYATPHIDSIAEQGCFFSDAYANSSVCSPTRMALATGRYQYRLRGGLDEPIGGGPEPVGLPPEHPTIASRLREAGYRTVLVGKWHLGSPPRFSPLLSGYDRFFGIHGGGADYFTHSQSMQGGGSSDLYDGSSVTDRHGYLTDILTERAVAEIDLAARTRKPLFLSLHYTAPHWPWEGPEDEALAAQIKSLLNYDGGSDSTFAKMVQALDKGVGKVLAALEAQGMTQDTIVVFTSDNGGERFSKVWPFDGMKGDLLEGGIRVPMMMRWPGKIPAGSRSAQIAMTMDYMPTFLATAGGSADPAFPSDGINLMPAALGQSAPAPRTVFWRYKAGEQAAARSGDWKMLSVNGHEYLFNLADDKQERANLKDSNPELFSKLKDEWRAWNETMLPYPDNSPSYSSRGKGYLAVHD